MPRGENAIVLLFGVFESFKSLLGLYSTVITIKGSVGIFLEYKYGFFLG